MFQNAYKKYCLRAEVNRKKFRQKNNSVRRVKSIFPKNFCFKKKDRDGHTLKFKQSLDTLNEGYLEY
jgi:hypothetical protein